MALCHRDTAHGDTCVFVFLQWHVIAMQIKEYPPQQSMCAMIQWADTKHNVRDESWLNFSNLKHSKTFFCSACLGFKQEGNLINRLIWLSACAFVYFVINWGSGVVGPGSVLEAIVTRAQTGGAARLSLRPSLETLGTSMMDFSWKWTGHSHNRPTPLMVPHTEAMRGLLITQSCIQTHFHTLKYV